MLSIITIFYELLIDAFVNMEILIRYYLDYFLVFVLATFGKLVSAKRTPAIFSYFGVRDFVTQLAGNSFLISSKSQPTKSCYSIKIRMSKLNGNQRVEWAEKKISINRNVEW